MYEKNIIEGKHMIKTILAMTTDFHFSLYSGSISLSVCFLTIINPASSLFFHVL